MEHSVVIEVTGKQADIIFNKIFININESFALTVKIPPGNFRYCLICPSTDNDAIIPSVAEICENHRPLHAHRSQNSIIKVTENEDQFIYLNNMVFTEIVEDYLSVVLMILCHKNCVQFKKKSFFVKIYFFGAAEAIINSMIEVDSSSAEQYRQKAISKYVEKLEGEQKIPRSEIHVELIFRSVTTAMETLKYLIKYATRRTEVGTVSKRIHYSVERDDYQNMLTFLYGLTRST